MKTSNQVLLTTTAIIVAIIVVIISFFGRKLENSSIKCDKNIISAEQVFEPFDTVILEGALDIEYILGESNTLTIEADSNLMQGIETRLTGKTLKIKNKITTRKHFKGKLSAPMARNITVSGGAKLNSKDTIQIQVLDFNINAGSSLSFIGNFDTINSTINAGAKAYLAGTCKKMYTSINAGSSLKSKDMEIEYLKINVNAGSKADIKCEELEASASAGSTIRYNKSAILRKTDISAGGSIRAKE